MEIPKASPAKPINLELPKWILRAARNLAPPKPDLRPGFSYEIRTLASRVIIASFSFIVTSNSAEIIYV